MNDNKKHVDECGCEHHETSVNHTHHMDGKCPTDQFVDKLIENLKKEFEIE